MSKNYFFKSLNIENYRGLQRLSILNLRRVNIIGGLNGVGKSTILEVIFLLMGRVNPLILNRPFSALNMQIPFPNGFDYIFTNFDIKKIIRVYGKAQTGDFEAIIKSANVDGMQINSQNAFTKKSDFSGSFDVNRGIMLNLETNNKSLKDELIFTQPTADNVVLNAIHANRARTPFCAIVSSATLNVGEDAQRYSVLLKERRTEQLFKYLRLLYSDLKNIQLLQENNAPVLYVEFSDNSLVQTILLGGGFQMMLSVALLMMTGKNGIFLFDEIDSTIHHSLLRDFWALVSQLANENNSQVFSVTHSRECIGAAVAGFREKNSLADLAYFRLEEGVDETNCISYDGSDLEDALSSDWEMR